MTDFTPQPTKRLTAIYVRVSTAEQKREGYSPEHQQKRLLAHIEQNIGLNLITRPDLLFMDVGTGSDLNRPQLDKMRELIRQKKVQAVIVWRIDRLSRNLKHLLMLFEEFQQHGASFISLQENIDFTGPIGRLIFQIFGSLAQFERELIKGRTYAGKVTSAEMGNYTRGDTPFGYRKIPNPKGKGKRLELVPAQHQWVETLYDWYVYRGWGDLKISNELNRRQVPLQSKQAKWTEKRVRAILTNSLYSGQFVAFTKNEDGCLLPPEEQTIVQVPACVSELLFRQAQKAREGRTGGHAEHDYLLSGKLVEISPDLPVPRKFVGAKRTKGGHSYRRKRFTHTETGTIFANFELPAEALEEFVWAKILKAFHNPAAFVEKYLRLNTSNDQVQEIEASLTTLRGRQAQITELELPNSERAYIKGIFSEESFSQRQQELNKELSGIDRQIDRLEEDMEGLAWVRQEKANLEAAGQELQSKLSVLTRAHRKMLCGLFVDRVEITRIDEPGKKREVTADIYFRFNLSRLSEGIPTVCTEEGQSGTGKTTSPKGTDALGGRAGRSGYIAPMISAHYAKISEKRCSNGVWYGHQECVWRERSRRSF